MIARVFVSLLIFGAFVPAQQSPSAKPVPTEGDYIAHDFHFKSGEALPELRLRTGLNMLSGRSVRSRNPGLKPG